MKWINKFLIILSIFFLTQSEIVFFNFSNLKALTENNTTMNKNSVYKYNYSTNNNYYRSTSIESYEIPTVIPKKNIKKLFDNERKIFDKNINIPANRIEYENLKEFISEKKKSLKKFDSIKFDNLSKSDIISYRKQLENVKSSDGIISFEKIIKLAKDNDDSTKFLKYGQYLYLLLGTFIGFLLFKYYTKKFLYRIEFVEELPVIENGIAKFEVGETQIINSSDFEASAIQETLKIAQQDVLLSKDKKENWMEEDAWLFASINQRED